MTMGVESELTPPGIPTITSSLSTRGGSGGRGSLSRNFHLPRLFTSTIVPISVTITGSGFQPGATVTLESGAGPTPDADVTDVSLDGFTIEATITAPGGGPPGTRVWDVRVTNPDSSTDVLEGAFAVVK